MAEPREQQPIDLEQLLKELEHKIERLKVLYEQYFMGIEKIEPLVSRKDVQRAMLQLQQIQIRNTGLRFKFNTMLQKWNIYITHWNRILREIENGTYVRHLAKAQRKAVREGKELPEELLAGTRRRAPSPVAAAEEPIRRSAAEIRGGRPAASAPVTPAIDRVFGSDDERDIDDALGAAFDFAAKAAPPATATARPQPAAPFAAPPAPPRSASPPAPGTARPAPPRAPAPPPAVAPRPAVAGLEEGELRDLHARFSAARKQSGEAQVSYESMVNSLSRQMGKLSERSGLGRVKFDVAVRDGRAVLKAIPQGPPAAPSGPGAPKK